MFEGKGILKTSVYESEGMFKNGMLNGMGCIKFNNGDFHRGAFKNNLLHGKRCFIETNYQNYKGF